MTSARFGRMRDAVPLMSGLARCPEGSHFYSPSTNFKYLDHTSSSWRNA